MSQCSAWHDGEGGKLGFDVYLNQLFESVCNWTDGKKTSELIASQLQASNLICLCYAGSFVFGIITSA